MTSLNSNVTSVVEMKTKLVVKGLFRNRIYCFNSVLDTKETHNVTNTGFKVLDHHLVTYKQKRRGLNYQYMKRKICEGDVSTLRLDL